MEGGGSSFEFSESFGSCMFCPRLSQQPKGAFTDVMMPLCEWCAAQENFVPFTQSCEAWVGQPSVGDSVGNV